MPNYIFTRWSLLFSFVLVLIALGVGLVSVSTPKQLATFKALPILHEGRVMPMDTFARRTLLTLTGKQTIAGISASAWLKNLLLAPEEHYQTPIIHVPNRALLQSLSLEPRAGNRFTFTEVAQALASNSQLITAAKSTPEAQLSDVQRALIDLTVKHTLLFDVSRSLSVFTPAAQMSLDNASQSLKVIPPASANPLLSWQSPWQASQSALPLTAAQQTVMAAWQNVLTSKDFSAIKRVTLPYADEIKLKLEVFYHGLDPIKVSLGFYLLALLLMLLAFNAARLPQVYAGLIQSALWAGIWLHIMAIVMRVLLTGRPPIATLYESIITTSLIAVLGFVVIYRYQMRPAVILAASTGILFHFVSFKFAYAADSFGVLVAVLNTNFWLGTHVTTMIIGYGFSFMASLLGAWYLLVRGAGRSATDALPILNITISVMLFALLFSTVGTILGGVWADQSWGRFWGWDPKENGALLLVLWQILLLHGRLKAFGPNLFAAGAVLMSVILALAWFGVNLLGVGLHSYGFTSGIAWKLAVFCVGLTVLTLLLYLRAIWRERRA